MKVTTFIRKKNKIIEAYTGIRLVPEEQIDKCPKHWLTMRNGDAGACPYCQVYLDFPSKCARCPMAEAGNWCHIKNPNSTYSQVIASYGVTNDEAPWHKELKKLIKKYNKGLK